MSKHHMSENSEMKFQRAIDWFARKEMQFAHQTKLGKPSLTQQAPLSKYSDLDTQTRSSSVIANPKPFT